MRAKNILNFAGVFSALLAIATLFGPIYSTYIADGEACNLIVKGYNLVEFSPWGSVALLVPLLLIGLMLSKLHSAIKTIGVLGLLLLDGVALSGSVAAVHTWIVGLATGFVDPHGHHLIYALFLLVSAVCFWVSANLKSADAQEEQSVAVTPSIAVEPVDYRKETFYCCNNVYDVAKYDEDGHVTQGEGVLCFATRDGYFAGMNDGEVARCFGAEYLQNNEAVAFVMGEMPTGVYGSFYEGQDFLTDPLMEVTIVPFENICEGEGEIKISRKEGITTCGDVLIRPYSPVDIRVTPLEDWGDPTAIGAAIEQGGELVGFVKEYDAANCEYKCISAEAMAVDLCRKVYEHRMAEAQQQKAANPLAQGR